MWVTSFEYNQNSKLFVEGFDSDSDGVFLTKSAIIDEVAKIQLINNDGKFLSGHEGNSVLNNQSGYVKREWKTEESAIKYRDLIVENYPELDITIEEVSDN
jgi:hypothetical protein